MSMSGEAYEFEQDEAARHIGADPDRVVEQLNSFLRGEISAVETYKMAIDKMARTANASPDRGIEMLKQIQQDHSRAAQSLRDRIRDIGGDPDDSSGVWGGWARFTQGTANIFGSVSSLKALKEGEEQGLNAYRDGCDGVDMLSSELVRHYLIPSLQRHIDRLDQMISTVENA